MSRTETTTPPAEPVDPDIDLHVPQQRGERAAHRWILPVIAIGGMIGASGRYALEQALPHATTGLPWATLVINVSGCALIGMLMVYVVEVGTAHPLIRPFLGVGVLGGFTTFSTYTVETHALILSGEPVIAMEYLFGTVLAALMAVTAGVVLARTFVDLRRRLSRRRAQPRTRNESR